MKYLICILVVVLGCQLTLAQVQSAASVRIELSINKTLTDFNKAIDKHNATIFKALTAETAAFHMDAKNAIVSIVSTSTIVANVGVSATASSYFEAVAKVSAAITLSDSNNKEKSNPEALVTGLKTIIDDFKAKLEVPIIEIREAVKLDIEANPKGQACYEKALKDIPALSAAANKNITASVTLAIKNFNAKAKIHHGYIKTNITLLTKAVSSCIAKKPQNAVFLCIDGLLLEVDKVLALITLTENDISQLYFDAYISISIDSEVIITGISTKKDAIFAKIAACVPAPPVLPAKVLDPAVTVDMTTNV